MTRKLGKLILISILVSGIAACKPKNNGAAPTPPPPVGTVPPPATPPTAPLTVAQQLGAVFATIFTAASTADPKDPAAGDLVAVSTTKEPIDF
jgi:hypothetical protein